MLISRPHIAAAAKTTLSCHLRRHWHSSSSASTSWPSLPTLDNLTSAAPHSVVFSNNRPIKIPRPYVSPTQPAIQKWFSPAEPSGSGGCEPNYAYLDPFASSTILPIELVTTITTSTSPSNGTPNSSEDDKSATKTSFHRASAPLSLWLSWSKLVLQEPQKDHNQALYIAQAPLSSLPPALQSDLPTPDNLISILGGSNRESRREPDIYASNLWMGIPPTYTPLHQDPNPNFLLQLAGRKIVRLMEPSTGRGVFLRGSRGEEKNDEGKEKDKKGMMYRFDESMMQGPPRERLEKLVWDVGGDDKYAKTEEEEEQQGEGKGKYEVELAQGEGLYIPRGWWHSVKGVGSGVTASANWWFR